MRTQLEEGALFNMASTDSGFVSLKVQAVPIERPNDDFAVMMMMARKRPGSNHLHRTSSGSKDSTDNGSHAHEPEQLSKRRRKKRAPTGW
jgi:hypothetical protein